MARDLVRDDVIHSAHTWVVKIGTSVLAAPNGTLDLVRIDHLTGQINQIIASGRRVALVSSGAIGAGMGQLALKRRPDSLPMLQAAAAVGQSYLIRAYDDGFRRQNRHAAQLLLTHEDFNSRTRYLNMRNTLTALFALNAVPVINENDTISTEEITIGDNDSLAAMVANLWQSPLLVVLSVAGGLRRRGANGELGDVIPLVSELNDDAIAHVDGSRSPLGTGGMRGKLEAVRQVTDAGGSAIIAPGRDENVLTRILAGETIGTLFLARGRTKAARKRWIGSTVRPQGRFVVDDGARAAVLSGTKSLLPIGIVEVVGQFERGDVVAVVDASGIEFARGLTNYSASESLQVAGRRTHAIRENQSLAHYDEVIHKDNLVLRY